MDLLDEARAQIERMADLTRGAAQEYAAGTTSQTLSPEWVLAQLAMLAQGQVSALQQMMVICGALQCVRDGQPIPPA